MKIFLQDAARLFKALIEYLKSEFVLIIYKGNFIYKIFLI